MAEFTSEKTKLTLGIDKDIIKKAKAAGINISSITEQLLNAMTFEPSKDILHDDIIKSYELFLNAVKQILQKYNIALTIGERTEWNYEEDRPVTCRIVLDSSDSLILWDDRIDIPHKVSVSQILNDLYPVNQILNDLLTLLVEVTEDSKQKMQELNFALKLLKTLSDEQPESR